MNHVFCIECGSKIEYAYSKPKFCSSCGSKCGGGHPEKKATSKFVKKESLAEDETDVDFIPDIDRLSVDIESSGNNVFTLGSLVGEKNSPKTVRSRGSRTIEDFIDDRRAK